MKQIELNIRGKDNEIGIASLTYLLGIGGIQTYISLYKCVIHTSGLYLWYIQLCSVMLCYHTKLYIIIIISGTFSYAV